MHVEMLYRYPVKGLSAEKITSAVVTPGDPIPWDRAFALALDDVPFNPDKPEHIHKINFLQLMNHERVALLESSFNTQTGVLSVSGPDGQSVAASVLTEEGRSRTAQFLVDFMAGELDGNAKFLFGPNHTFNDAKERAVSIINLASIRDLEQRVDGPRHLMRFRANIYFTGQPWEELEWMGRELRVGSARLRVIRPIPRCPATQVNLETAIRDVDPVAELRATYGHTNLGAFTVVVGGGEFAVGDRIELV